MSDNNQEPIGFDDSGLSNTETIDSPRSASVDYGEAKNNATKNLKQTFGSGPGLIAAIAVGIVILLFLAFGIRGMAQSDSRSGIVNHPDAPNKTLSETVTPEEAERRRQVAMLEAQQAAEQGQTYQASFDVNIQDPQSQYVDGNAGYNIHGQVPETLQQASGAQATPQPSQEQQLAQQQQAAAAAAYAQQKQAYDIALAERDQVVQNQRQLIGTQIEGIYKNMLPNGRHTSSVYYSPKPDNANQDDSGNGNGHNNVFNNQSTHNALSQNQGINNPNSGLDQGQRAPYIKAGTLLFAQLDTEIDTDDGGPVMATIYGGKLNGAKIMGQVQQANGNIRLAFNTVSPIEQNKPTFTVNAVALRTEDAKQGIATSINNHTLSRYTSLVFSSALSGISNAYANRQTGTVTQLNNGATVISQNSVSDRELIGQAVGQVGNNLSGEAMRGFSRPPTYKVARGTGLAVYFLYDLYLN